MDKQAQKETHVAFLSKVQKLAEQGKSKKQIAEELEIKSTLTLNNKLVKASQLSGKPIPPFSRGSKGAVAKKVEVVEVRQRGRGDAFGVNIPQEPLTRFGVKPGDKLNVEVRRKIIVLTKI